MTPRITVIKDADTTLRINECGATMSLWDNEGLALITFTEDTCQVAINSLHRMLDHIICENAKKDLKGAAHE